MRESKDTTRPVDAKPVRGLLGIYLPRPREDGKYRVDGETSIESFVFEPEDAMTVLTGPPS